ncbi:transposase [Elysia marginata]|uniref:Transposase n=1 Tax=Elysia marginata TaxID=1093978 RepID=A0AAV4FIL0_9GAST|nr:transposase [Elysia marginata]
MSQSLVARKTLTDEENITRVDELIKCDRRMKIREVVLKLEIPKSAVHEIVHDFLGYRKYLNTPEAKRDSMTWKHPSSPVTKKFKVQRSAAKVMATVFWGAKGAILYRHFATASVYQCCPILHHS